MKKHSRLVSVLLAVILHVLLLLSTAWFLNDLAQRPRRYLQNNYANLEAVANCHTSLHNAERMALIAIIQAEKLHPDVSAALRDAIEQAQVESRLVLANDTVLGQRADAEQLLTVLDVIARLGEDLLAAPPNQRHARYVEPDVGLQSAMTKAWQLLNTIRARHEVAMDDSDQSARDASRSYTVVLTLLILLSLTVTLLGYWRCRCVLPSVAPPNSAIPASLPSDVL